MNKQEFINTLLSVNRTKSDKAYLIGMAEPHNTIAVFYVYNSKQEVDEEFVRVVNQHTDKLAKRLVNSSKEGEEAREYIKSNLLL